MTTEGETSTEPSVPPQEAVENKEVAISLEEAKRIDYEDLRVVVLEKKGPLHSGVKILIWNHYVVLNNNQLLNKLITLRKCNTNRRLDKFERCELETMQKIMNERIGRGSAASKNGKCTLV